jgi:hypothetical protein
MELTVQVTLGGYSRSQVHGNLKIVCLWLQQVKPAIFISSAGKIRLNQELFVTAAWLS